MDNDCWEWTSAKIKAGYGEFHYQGKPVYAHRFAYELLKGKIPKGFHIDHLCRNTICVNPEHMEPVTCKENLRRGEHVNQNTFKTHCIHGHEFTAENTYYHLRKSGTRRYCKTCIRINSRKYLEKRNYFL